MRERLVAIVGDAVLTIVRSKDKVCLIASWSDGVTADSWYPTVNDARHHAKVRWGSKSSAWRNVPDEVDDPIAFALSQESRMTQSVLSGGINTEADRLNAPEQLIARSSSSSMDMYKYYSAETKEHFARRRKALSVSES